MLKSRKDKVEEMYILTKKHDDVLLPMVIKRDGSFSLCWSRSLYKLQTRYINVADKIVIEVQREDYDELQAMVREFNNLAQDYVDVEDGVCVELKRPIAIHPVYGEPSFRYGYNPHCNCDCNDIDDYDE